MRKLSEPRPLERVGDAMCNGRRAIDGGQDADVVPSGNATVRTHDPIEGRLRLGIARGLRVDSIGVVARELTHGEVVQVNVLARSDCTFGKADDLVVALHRFAGAD